MESPQRNYINCFRRVHRVNHRQNWPYLHEKAKTKEKMKKLILIIIRLTFLQNYSKPWYFILVLLLVSVLAYLALSPSLIVSLIEFIGLSY